MTKKNHCEEEQKWIMHGHDVTVKFIAKMLKQEIKAARGIHGDEYIAGLRRALAMVEEEGRDDTDSNAGL